MAIFEYDIFVSYAHRDNTDKWVDTFLKDLDADFKKTGNSKSISIWKDRTHIEIGDSIKEKIRSEGLSQSRLLMPILSPSYFQRPYCCLEFVEFLAMSGVYKKETDTLDAKVDGLRIIPILKYPIGEVATDGLEPDHVVNIQVIQRFLNEIEPLFIEFSYEDEGVVQDLLPGDAEYPRRLRRVSSPLGDKLKSVTGTEDAIESISSAESRKGIFVSVGPSFSDERAYLIDKIKNELPDLMIYPDAVVEGDVQNYDLYGQGEEIEQNFYHYLEKCSFSVHLIRDSRFNYFDKVQLDLASRFYSSDERRFVSTVNFISTLKGHEESANYFKQVKEETNPNLIVKENQNVNKFKDLTFDYINIWREELTKDKELENVEAQKDKSQRYVYVTYGKKSPEIEGDLAMIRDRLSEKNVFVTFYGPGFNQEIERDYIIQSDGVILYHGDEVDTACVMKQLNIRKLMAEKDTPCLAKRMFVDDPDKVPKIERFKGSDFRILNGQDAALTDSIDGFINDMSQC